MMEIIGILIIGCFCYIWLIRKWKATSVKNSYLEVVRKQNIEDAKQYDLNVASKKEKKAILSKFELEAYELELLRNKTQAAADNTSYELEIKAKEEDAEKLKLHLSALKTNLPFYTSNRTPSSELSEHDKNNWEYVTRLIRNENSEMVIPPLITEVQSRIFS
jgi:hypothetical protein